MIWAVVPAKTGRSAKERLAGALAPAARTRLAEAMLTDVLKALRQSQGLEATVVVSREEETLELAREQDCHALTEEGSGGLNPAVLQGISYAVERGATGILIAMGDLPLLRAEDIEAALARLPDTGQVLVPSADGTGTNLVLSRPAEVFEPHFGPGSLRLHQKAAQKREVTPILFPCSGPSLDIDTPADLERLQTSQERHGSTARVLEENAGRANSKTASS